MKWTIEELTILKENCGKSLKQLGERLPGRAIKAIKKKRLKLGLASKRHNWTLENLEILQKNYRKSAKEINLLLPQHNLTSIRSKRAALCFRCTSKWTDAEVNILRMEGPHRNTKDMLSVLPTHSLNSIRNKLHELGISKTAELMSDNGRRMRMYDNYHPYYKLDQTFTLDDLDNTTYQVLIGSMLGDGSVVHKQGKYVFSEGHGLKQTEYLRWKQKRLNVFAPTFYVTADNSRLSTPSHPIFLKIASEWYRDRVGNKCFIVKHYIDRLDELGFLIWYLDDGSLGSGSPTILSTLFSEENLNNIITHLNCRLGLNLYLRTYKPPKGKRLSKYVCIPACDRSTILGIWEPLFDDLGISGCMRYKLGMKIRTKTSLGGVL